MLIALWACAACADPSLRIVVDHSAAAPDLVALADRVEISVYEREGLTCDEIAFRKLSDEELAAILRSKGEGSVAAIPRLGRKAVVARAYSSKTESRPERLILAGCAEIDEVMGQDRVVIATEPVASVGLESSILARANGAVEISVVAVDARQRGINGKEVSWTTWGPTPKNGSEVLEPQTPLKLTAGELTFMPSAPTMGGPFAVQARVKWSNALPPLVTSAIAKLPVTRLLAAAPQPLLNACAIYQSGRPVLACIEQDLALGRVLRSYRLMGNALLNMGAPQPVANAVAVLGIGDGVAVINADGSYTTLFGTARSGTVCNGACAAPFLLLDVLGFAGCPALGTTSAGLFAHFREAGVAKLVGTTLADNRKYTFPLPGGDTPALGTIGCVTDLETGTNAQVAATVDTATTNHIFLFQGDVIDRVRERRLPGTGFAPAGGKGSREARILTTEIDATGFVVVESVLAKPASRYLLFERRRSAAVAPPRHYVSGSFDGDDEVDLAWDVIDEVGAPARSIQVLLGAKAGRPALSGRLPLPDTADLLAADLDGDDLAEIIGYSNQSVSVQRVGSAAP